MKYINIVVTVPYIDLYQCDKCKVWSVEKKCNCEEEKAVTKKKED